MAQKIVKRKKKWFTVVAPEIFKNREISEIPAFEPDDLISRFVEVNLMQVTGVPKDQQKKMLLKITEVKGEKVYTVPSKYYLIYSFIQRSSRRFKEKFISVLKLKTKDNKTIKIKFNIMAEKKLHQRVRAQILEELEARAREKISEINSDNLFIPLTLDKLAAEIRKEIRSVYPINKLLIWKLTLIE